MKTGRPKNTTKLTPELIDTLANNLLSGLTIQDACFFAGVSVSSFRNWRIIGEKQRKGIFSDFSRAIEPIFAEKEAQQEKLYQAKLKLIYERHMKKYSCHNIDIESYIE